MFDTEVLGTMAQVGLGLAGFSGIALVLTQGGARLARFEAYRLGIMLGPTLGASFLALLPLVLLGLGLAPVGVARVAAGVMAAFTAGFVAYFLAGIRHMRVHVPELVTAAPVVTVVLGHAGNLVLQLWSAAAAPARAPGVYLLGVFWLLAHGAYQFGRILFIRPQRASPAAGERVRVRLRGFQPGSSARRAARPH